MQVLLTSPKSCWQLEHPLGPEVEQVRQLLSQASHLKVVWLVNWSEAQARHCPAPSRPNPEAHWVQFPVVASQAVQLEQSEQMVYPSREKVLLGQAEQLLLGEI